MRRYVNMAKSGRMAAHRRPAVRPGPAASAARPTDDRARGGGEGAGGRRPGPARGRGPAGGSRTGS
jgi:hypothetical protein